MPIYTCFVWSLSLTEIAKATTTVLCNKVQKKKYYTVPAEILCFHDYGQEIAYTLLYYPKIGRNHRQNNGKKSQNFTRMTSLIS